jgi:hypothetical protein
LYQRTKYHQDNTKNSSSPKATPLKREQCTSAVIALIVDHMSFHPGESRRLQNNAFNKLIVRHNQLRPDLGFSPVSLDNELLMCYRPHKLMLLL